MGVRTSTYSQPDVCEKGRDPNTHPESNKHHGLNIIHRHGDAQSGAYGGLCPGLGSRHGTDDTLQRAISGWTDFTGEEALPYFT